MLRKIYSVMGNYVNSSFLDQTFQGKSAIAKALSKNLSEDGIKVGLS